MATVVGPPGEEIYCDEWGRVKVSFPWDRESEGNEFSSCWVRVSQGWAGGSWGSMAIPRIGQDVIVQYVNGDPDQPIVTIITETKYRTGGVFSPGSLPVTKGSEGYPSARQMSDAWIHPRLADEVGERRAAVMYQEGYERWLMIVDERGAVTQISKLDKNARVVGEVAI